MIKLFKRYTAFELLYLTVCYIRGKVINKNIRLIRFPIQLRNISRIYFGKHFTTGVGCRLEIELNEFTRNNKEKILMIGENVQINDYVHITAVEKVVIGNNVLIASKVYISDTAHGEYQSKTPSLPTQPPSQRPLVSKPVVIEDNVWIGDGVCILPGVSIGYGAIIGANSVVNKNIPAMCIAVGIPAKVIKKFNTDLGLWEAFN